MAVDAAQKYCVDAVQHGKILDDSPPWWKPLCTLHQDRTLLISSSMPRLSIIKYSCNSRRKVLKYGERYSSN